MVRASKTLCLLAGAVLLLGALVYYSVSHRLVARPQPTYAGYAGSASCRECHADTYIVWAKSNHGLAERLPRPDLDQAAFTPARTFQFGTQKTEVKSAGENYFITCIGLSDRPETHQAERVIGNDPLRQFLVAALGGRWQAMEAAYDPHRNEWFDVFGKEDRQPGEWGHWTGRGMNWNSMCAGCHNTRLQKNYDEAADSYHTTMAEMSVSCEACHGPLQAHVDWQRQHQNDSRITYLSRRSAAKTDHALHDPTLPKFTPAQIMDTCASCHSRRSDLTGDFKPGDSFFDHFDLSIVDHSDVLYPDGQVREEDYEYTAFLGSKMCQAGVTCLDCHSASIHTSRPQGNAVCLRCHASGLLKAPVIQPEAHSHHQAGSTGDNCIGCHMPVTVYMQRHLRHDHGFTIPDPVLTKKFGIPNACNRCHTDKDTGWSLAAVEKWYGQKMERPTRQRAEWIALARQGDASARGPLLAILNNNSTPAQFLSNVPPQKPLLPLPLGGEGRGEGEGAANASPTHQSNNPSIHQSTVNSYWQAVAANLLDQWADDPAVNAGLVKCLSHRDPLVRAAALRALEPLAEQPNSVVAAQLRTLLTDPSRNVRIAAAWALRTELDTNSTAGRELLRYLGFNADQPPGQMQKGVFYFSRGDLASALEHFQKAVSWDTDSAPLHREYAVALSAAGRNAEAIEQLQAACRLAPRETTYYYELGLVWKEAGNLSNAIESLETAVKLDPANARAWYNLGLARNAAGQIEPALEALRRAETAAPTDPRIPYARATILVRQGRVAEAKAAAQRALTLQPDFTEAARLMEALSQQ